MFDVNFVVILIAATATISVQADRMHDNKNCIRPLGDETVNLNELYLSSGYILTFGNRTFAINICGSVPKCGSDIAACEIRDKQIIPLGYYSTLAFLPSFLPNIGLKYRLNTKKYNYATIEFICNRHFKNHVFKFEPEQRAGRHHRFTFESAFVCVHRNIDCVVKNNYYETQIDLAPLYKPNNNWLVKNAPENSEIYLNICGDLNPIGDGQKSRGAQVSLVDTSNNTAQSLGLLSQDIIIEDGFISATFTDGFECSVNRYSSTRIEFLCSFIEKGPELISYTRCDYFIKWFTPNACPHKVVTYDGCTFRDEILGQVDLTNNKLSLKSNEKHVADDSLLKFNICGSLDSCNGQKDVSFCLLKNNTEIVFGKTSQTIISKDGLMRMEFQGDLCSSNHINRSVKVTFICDYSQQIREEINLIDTCEINLVIYTNLVCPNYNSNSTSCKSKPVNGTYYDLSEFALLDRNLEVMDSDDPNLTYVLQICRPVISSEHVMCDQSSVCVRNNSEPDLYRRFKTLGSYSETPEIYAKNNSLILHHNGIICPYNIDQAVYTTEIEFRCSNKSNLAPILQSKSKCTYIFIWETIKACSIAQHEKDEVNATVSTYDISFNSVSSTKSDIGLKINNNNDDNIMKHFEPVLTKFLKHFKTKEESTNEEKRTESPNNIINTESHENEPSKNVKSLVNIHEKDTEIGQKEETSLKSPVEITLNDLQNNETPINVESHEDKNEAKLIPEIIDHRKIFRSLVVPMNIANSNGININNCTVSDQIHKFNMNSLPHLVNITSNSGRQYSIDICNNKTENSCQTPFCKHDTLTNLFLVPHNRFISMNFYGKMKCNDGYYNSVLFLKCSEEAQQPSIIKEEECSVHLEWKNKGTCAFFEFDDHTAKPQRMSGSTTAAIVVPVILIVFVIISTLLFYFWRNKQQRTSNIDSPLRCYDRIHYTRVKDSAKIV